jgi:hypothetical protein
MSGCVGTPFLFVVIEKRILHNRSIHAIFGEGIER